MKMCNSFVAALIAALIGASLPIAVSAQENPPAATPDEAPAGKPGEAEMMAKMMELAKPGEHHRQLAELVGTWAYAVKFAVAPGAPLADSGSGSAVRTALMDGRYFSMDVSGKMLTPAADGKMLESEFKGMSLEGYDNVKQKFVSTWIDNMGTSIVLSEGAYDSAAKNFTYLFEMEVMPGMKVKGREVVTILDRDHYRMDWYEKRGDQDVKTMEISYTRQK